MTDEELMRAYVGGDAEAFGELVRRHVDFVHGVASREVGGGDGDADDVTQAVFLLLSKKAAGLQGRGSIAGWLFTAARLCARNARRAERRRRDYERKAAMNAVQAHVEIDAEMGALLNQAIGALGAAERELVVLRHLEGREVTEIAGALGISAAAATKRVQRAVEKMRVWFARRGKMMSVGAVTGVLAAAALHKAPVALAVGVGSGGAASAGAMVIAKSAGTAMVLGPLKVAAAVLVVMAAGAAGTAAVVAHQNAGAKGSGTSVATAPAVPEAVVEESPALGEPMAACFDMLVDESVAAEMRKSLVGMESGSKVYAGYRGSSERVLEILRRSIEQQQQVPGQGSSLRWDVAENLNTNFQERVNGVNVHGLSNVWEMGKPGAAATKRGLTLAVNKRVKISTTDDAAPWQESTGEIHFEQEVAAGETVVFLAEAGEVGGRRLVHVMAWQVFRVLPDQREAIESLYEVKEWLRQGPEGMRELADRSLLWWNGAPAAQDIVVDKYVRKLANGARVRLLAVSRPAEAPMCWWSARGERVNNSNAVWVDAQDKPLAVMMDWEAPLPGHAQESGGSYSVGGTIYYGATQGQISTMVGEADGVDIGVSTGAWKDAGVVTTEGLLDAGGVQVTVRGVESSGEGVSMPEAEAVSPADVEVRVLAVDGAGVRVGDMNGLDVSIGWPGVHINKPAGGTVTKLSPNMKIAPGAIDHFVVQTRKVEWARFEGFAITSKDGVPEAADGEKLAALRGAAAEATEKVRVAAATMEAKQAATAAEWLAHGDATTPMGVMATMVREARANNKAGILKMIATANDGETARAKLIADFLSAHEQLRLAAEKKFGRAAVEEKLLKTNLLFRMEEQLSDEWKIDGDKATEGDGSDGPMMKRVGKEWRMDGASLSGEVVDDCRVWPALVAAKKRLDGNEFSSAEALGAAIKQEEDALAAQIKGEK